MNIFWFRRDLRLDDNAGLYHALKSGEKVQCIFIFDKSILSKLEDKADARVSFIHDQISRLQKELNALGSSIWVYHSTPAECFTELIKKNNIKNIYTNHDYEPYARQRDASISQLVGKAGIGFHTFKDQVIFEKDEVLKDDGKPYTVFTPYKNKWYKKLKDFYLKAYPTQNYFHQLILINDLYIQPCILKHQMILIIHMSYQLQSYHHHHQRHRYIHYQHCMISHLDIVIISMRWIFYYNNIRYYVMVFIQNIY